MANLGKVIEKMKSNRKTEERSKKEKVPEEPAEEEQISEEETEEDDEEEEEPEDSDEEPAEEDLKNEEKSKLNEDNQVMFLQDNGIFRLELLRSFAVLNNHLLVQNALLKKIMDQFK